MKRGNPILDSDDSIIAKNPYDAASKPGTPNIVDYNEHMVKLKWEAPRSDGGAPISGYIIEKKISSLLFGMKSSAPM